MKWIVLAILAFIAVYTALTLSFRKPGPAYRPYEDAKERAVVARLEEAGFERIAAVGDQPAEQRPPALGNGARSADILDTIGGLPAQLRETLLDPPQLPQAIQKVTAPAESNSLLPYSIEFSCVWADNKQVLAHTYAYARENELVIVPEFEAIDGELRARSRETGVHLTLPGGTLEPGTYEVTLVGERGSKRWSLLVH